MKLELEHELIDSALQEELEFSRYLQRFTLDIPIIPQVILRPFNQTAGEEHFNSIQKMATGIQEKNINLNSIINESKTLPNLDQLLNAYTAQGLEQYHLYLLGTFITKAIELEALEKRTPPPLLIGIKETLEKFTENNFSSINIKTTDHSAADTEINNLIANYEQHIFNECGIKMLYPYPKEIPSNHPAIKRIQNSTLLNSNKTGEYFLISYNLPTLLKQKLQAKEQIAECFKQKVDQFLSAANRELYKYFDVFKTYYQHRKKVTYLYALIYVKNRDQLCFPLLQKSVGLNLINGILQSLEQRKRDHYVPLTLNLSRGGNLLFGANMAGKTTVLKTLFFHLTLVQLGLPVPAEKLTLSFPETISFHLHTSGSTKTGLSGFGDELNFFAKEVQENSYILADELFQSTNPISGIELSSLFLEYFSDKNFIFFCNSHYAELLKSPHVNLFRMKEIEVPLNANKKSSSIKTLLETNPFVVEQISNEENTQALEESKKPLYIALHFDLPLTIKKKITERLKG